MRWCIIILNPVKNHNYVGRSMEEEDVFDLSRMDVTHDHYVMGACIHLYTIKAALGDW
jgi:hypothetical protein